MSLKTKITCIILCIVFITIMFLVYLNKKVVPIVSKYSTNELKRIVSLLINDSISDSKIKEYNIEDYIIMTKNSSGDIVTIDFNSNLLNNSLWELSELINQRLYNLKNNQDIEEILYFHNNDLFYQVPYGVISGLPIVSMIGPKIPIKIDVIGNVITGIRTEVMDYGINNALIKMYLSVDIEMLVMLPFTSETITVNNEIPVLIKLVQGNVPSIYGGMVSEKHLYNQS